MNPQRFMLVVAITVCAVFSVLPIGSAQQPSPIASPTRHVPIALPEQAPPGYDPPGYAHFRQRCQEVADKSSANLPMDSGDYAYAEACTERGAFYRPVKLRPTPAPIQPTATPIATPGPDGHVPMLWDLPKDPPKGTFYEKETRAWANLRAMCQAIADEAYEHKTVDHEAVKACGRAVTLIRAVSGESVSQSTVSPAHSPLPTVTPTPASAGALGPVSSAASVGPFGTPFNGGGGDACASPSPTPGYQPPDVAADVSPLQLVQVLNQGIWVFDKTGKALNTQTLQNFWASKAPPPTNLLTDTQVAYDHLALRWVVTALSVPPGLPRDYGDLLLAISNTSDASNLLNWTFYKYPQFCGVYSSTTNPYSYPDQPILGFNQTWDAIDVPCLDHLGVASADKDQLLLIPHNEIASHPVVLDTIQEPGPVGGWFAARPSRDLSSAGQNIYLVSSGPFTSSTPVPDFVQVTSINSAGAIVGPGPGGTVVRSPTEGVPSIYAGIAPAQHDSCGASSTCVVDLSDARISSAPILQAGNDGKHYLLTAFHAADSIDNTSEALYFVGQSESFAQTAQWNHWYIGGAPGWWAAYPTITMDQDLDEAYSFTTFYLGSTIYPNWYTAKGFVLPGQSYGSPPFTGYGILYSANSQGSYTGKQLCSTQTTQRWGDYMSLLWDPNFPASANPPEADAFWMVQEYTTGGGIQPGSDQSTKFVPLQDPLPFFVGYSVPVGPTGNVGEDECIGQFTCSLTFTAPANAQYGDVFAVAVPIGEVENSDGSQFHPPAGWRVMPLANKSNIKRLLSDDGAGNILSVFFATYIYGSQSNDTGQYTFNIDSFPPSAAEAGGFLVAYRGANTDLTKYTLNGYPHGAITAVVTASAITPPAESTLMSLFGSGCLNNDNESKETTWSYTAPTGSPAETAETSLSSTGNLGMPFLVADVPVTTGGVSHGPYKTNGCFSINFAYNLIIPE